MKRLLETFIFPLVVALVGVFFASEYNKESVDLRYTLSGEVATKYLGSKPIESVQKLVVKNNGDLPVSNINIKFFGDVVEYDLVKNTMSDNVIDINTKGQFESVYPLLPPKGEFLYTFKTAGEAIDKSAVKIFHSKGKATEALSGSSNDWSSAGYFFAIFFPVFYLFLMIIQGRSMAVENFESKGKYASYDEYLNKSKPFYFPHDKWLSIRKSYISGKNKSKIDRFSSIEQLESYKILNQDRPNYLSVDEWALLKEVSIESLTGSLNYRIGVEPGFRQIFPLVGIERPVSFPVPEWKKLVERLSEEYVARKKIELVEYPNAKSVVNEIMADIPEGMPQNIWGKYEDYLRNLYFTMMVSDIVNGYDPLYFLKVVDRRALSGEDSEKLDSLAYGIAISNFDGVFTESLASKFLENDRPEWLKEPDFSRFYDQAKTVVSLDSSIKRYHFFQNSMKNIVSSIPLGDHSPAYIAESDWADLKRLEASTVSVALKAKEEKEKILSDKKEVEALKVVVLKQLDIIDSVLTDPKSIDRVESYENPFSKGNFRNLEKVSALLRSREVVEVE